MYKHTFYLLSGEIKTAKSYSKDLAHLTIGRETAFCVDDGKCQYVIPFFSVGYIETEEVFE